MYNQYLSQFKAGYLMYIPLTIILQSCIGSVAAMYILVNSHKPMAFVELFLCVSVSMIYNAAVLAQIKVKYVFNLLLLSLLVNTILIVINVAESM